jgi:hypothetical protein
MALVVLNAGRDHVSGIGEVCGRNLCRRQTHANRRAGLKVAGSVVGTIDVDKAERIGGTDADAVDPE